MLSADLNVAYTLLGGEGGACISHPTPSLFAVAPLPIPNTAFAEVGDDWASVAVIVIAQSGVQAAACAVRGNIQTVYANKSKLTDSVALFIMIDTPKMANQSVL